MELVKLNKFRCSYVVWYGKREG